MIVLCKVIKREYASDLAIREKAIDSICRFLSSCADEQGDDQKYFGQCTIVAQPRKDGMLALIGTLDMEPTPFYRQEIVDPEVEFIMPAVELPSARQPVDPIFHTR